MLQAKFKDKVIIITGASSGVGEQLAYKLAGQGAKLVLAARRAEKLEKVAAACRSIGGEAASIQTDVSKEDACKSLIDAAISKYGRLDALFNNAGFGLGSRFDEIKDLEIVRCIINTNLLGSIYCAYYALPHLKKTQGRIVNVSSVAGKIASPGNSVYNASKFGMSGFFDALRVELFDSKVSVTTIYPGFIVTEFAQNMCSSEGKPFGDEASKLYNIKVIMDAKTCAKIIVDAAAQRKRDVCLTPLGRNPFIARSFGCFLPILCYLFPNFTDWFMRRFFTRLRWEELFKIAGKM